MKVSAMSINCKPDQRVTLSFDRTVGAGYEQVQNIGPSRECASAFGVLRS